MLPDRVSNPGPLTYESGALPTALHGLADILTYVINDESVLITCIPCLLQNADSNPFLP